MKMLRKKCPDCECKDCQSYIYYCDNCGCQISGNVPYMIDDVNEFCKECAEKIEKEIQGGK